MRKTITAIVIAAIAATSMMGTAQARPDDDPYRLGVRYGERIGIPHEGPMCWRFNQGPRGRWRAVIVQGERAERGAPCRGPRTAIVKLPWGIQEDAIRVWTTDGHVWLITLRYFD